MLLAQSCHLMRNGTPSSILKECGLCCENLVVVARCDKLYMLLHIFFLFYMSLNEL